MGTSSVAFGSGNTASGRISTAFGITNTAFSFAETAFGMHGSDYTPTSTTGWVGTDRLVNIGNGDGAPLLGPQDNSDAFTILKNGDTGIGIDNFETYTNGNIFQVGDGTNSIIGYVDDATGNWVAVSDERKKENITDLSYGLNEVLQLRPTSFNYKRNGEHTIGFLAQQVLPIIPEAVYGTESEGYGMSYTTLTPVLVKAIQEMNLNVVDLNNIERPNTWRDALIAWFENASNGIRSLVVRDKICVDDQCLTRDDIQVLLQLKNQQNFIAIPPTNSTTPDNSPVVPDPEVENNNLPSTEIPQTDQIPAPDSIDSVSPVDTTITE